jgi:hypothetical protein
VIKLTKSEEELKRKLDWLAPDVMKIGVLSPDPLINIHYVDLSTVCYITTRNAMEDNTAAQGTGKKKKPPKAKTLAAKQPATNKITAGDSKETSGEIVFVCADGTEYSNYSSLKDLEIILETERGNPWFMRTSNSHIVNLKMITNEAVNNARDLYFVGNDKPVINAVTRTYFEKYKLCPYLQQ